MDAAAALSPRAPAFVRAQGILTVTGDGVGLIEQRALRDAALALSAGGLEAEQPFAASIHDVVRAHDAARALWPDATARVSTPRAVRERRDAEDAPTLPPLQGAALAYAGRPGEQGEVRLRTRRIEQSSRSYLRP